MGIPVHNQAKITKTNTLINTTMNLDYQHLIPEDFSPNSRVWIYQSNRIFTFQEALNLEPQLEDFSSSWQSHGTPVKATALLFYGQFIILMADETVTGVSGCSTDSSVRFIKSIEAQFGVSLFDRTTLGFIVNEKVELLPMNQLGYAYEQGFIHAETLFFDNSVQTKSALLDKWMVPVSQSWLAKRLNHKING
jgi:hypothetical protein